MPDKKVLGATRRKYEEHHFGNVEDVGIAFNEDRIWVCINGQATLRAKLIPGGKLFVEYYKPSEISENEVTSVMIEPKMNDEQVTNEIREPWDEPTERCAKALNAARLEAQRLDDELAELVSLRQSDARNGWPQDKKTVAEESDRLVYCFVCSLWATHAEACCPSIVEETTPADITESNFDPPHGGR